MKVEVREPFRKFIKNPYIWAIGIDSLDIASNIVDFVLTGVLGLGIVTNEIFDIFQTGLALIVFEDSRIGIFNEDFLLPAPFDILPSFTANVYILENIIK